MNRSVRALALVPAVFSLGLVLAQATQTTGTAAALTPRQIEEFLLRADVVATEPVNKGVTNSTRVTLSDGRTTHDAHVQSVDVAMPLFDAGRASEVNFKDSYRFNVAAYRLARLLNLNVPVSVERRINGKVASVTWWVDDVMMDEGERTRRQAPGPDRARTSNQLSVMRVFDELIQNVDRNQGNLLWTSDWSMWMIDHTRAFRLGKELRKPEYLLRCDRSLYEKLRRLRREEVKEAVGDSLTNPEIDALLSRRDAIVKFFEDRIARRGEAVVLFTLLEP
jgi:hypothetical protein